ncbi:putative transcription factor TIFY family [Helianthus annuus]|nr:putative transcription factor TIFY family [Helianthus annuus]KAJ0807918.1 putative transcription factor TIFY family [Helianthus annuus]
MSEIVDSGNKESTFAHTVNLLSHYLKENGMGSRGAKENRMTIIYGGQVVVVDDFPADRAKEIMMLARRRGNTPADWIRKHSAHNDLAVAAAAADLPLARKASLARFLEKRKERITARAAAAAAASEYDDESPSKQSKPAWIDLLN